ILVRLRIPSGCPGARWLLAREGRATSAAMAKKGKMPKPRDAGRSLEGIERPSFNWKTVGIIVAAFATLWITAAMILSYDDGGVFGWIVFGVVCAMTVAGIGFGIYIWR